MSKRYFIVWDGDPAQAYGQIAGQQNIFGTDHGAGQRHWLEVSPQPDYNGSMENLARNIAQNKATAGYRNVRVLLVTEVWQANIRTSVDWTQQ